MTEPTPDRPSTKGAPCPIGHVEIPAPDFETTKAFYTEVFGWTIQDVPGYGKFAMFQDGGVGGALNGSAEVGAPGIEPYITVDDIPAALARIQTAGGQVVQEKTAIGGDFGFVGQFLDPNGTRMGLWART